MRNLLLIITGTLLILTDAAGQPIILKGHSPQYRDTSFAIETLLNPFTEAYHTVDTLIISGEGSFETPVELPEPAWLKIDFGIFRSTLYAEPGKTYTLELPPAREKSEADIRNPYFRPVNVHMKVLREEIRTGRQTIDDLNARMFRFDTLIFSKNEQLVISRQRGVAVNADSLISAIETRYEKDTSEYFSRYRKYRYGLTLLDSRDRMLDEVSEKYLAPGGPHPIDPAYMDLFDRMFDKFLFFYSGTEQGKPLKKIINRDHDLQALRTVLRNHPAIPDDTLADMVIMKEVSQAYYRDFFYSEALLILLDSLKSRPSVPQFSFFAQGIRDDLTRLAIGSIPPDFRLLDQNGQWRSLEDFRGKYIYLNFCTTDNYSCLSEYPFLKAIYSKHSDYLEIVTVMVCDTHSIMKKFMDRNGYAWPALFYGNDEELLRTYKIKAYPAAFLLGPGGTLIQSPATPATEGFEQQLFRIMRSRGDL